jgi:hypothetical protein
MFLYPNIFGSYDTRDLPRLVIGGPGVDEAQVMADIRQWAKLINDAADSYIALLAADSDKVWGTFGTGNGGGEMQPYTEYGETEATRVAESYWVWGLPIRRWRDRQMYTEEIIATKTLEQLNKDTIAATNRFLTTKVKMVLRAVFGQGNYTFNDTIFPGSEHGPLAVKRLFNADGTAGQMFANNAPLSIGAIQSYVPSGSASLTTAQFTLNRTKLRERGYLGRVLHIVAQADQDAVKALPGFILSSPLDPNVNNPYANTTYGADVTITRAEVTRPYAIGVFSNGGASDGEVIAMPFFPSGYVLSTDATQIKPVGIRQHEKPEFRGWRLIQDQTKTAYGEDAIRNKLWEYIAGAGVINRANGVVSLATVGAYAAPII